MIGARVSPQGFWLDLVAIFMQLASLGLLSNPLRRYHAAGVDWFLFPLKDDFHRQGECGKARMDFDGSVKRRYLRYASSFVTAEYAEYASFLRIRKP